MKRLSSNLTIFLKIFIPIFYLVFFGSFLIGSLMISVNDAPFIGSNIFRLGYAGVFVVFILLLYFSIFKLKRVDADSQYVYISNYMKTLRFDWKNVEKISTRNYGLFSTMRIYFKDKTSYGRKISFLPVKALIKDFVLENPELYDLLIEE